jgi:Ca2+-transporting ATPase
MTVGASLSGAAKPELVHGRPATFDGSPFTGLNDRTVRERLLADGPNELPSSKARGVLSIAVDVARQPMFMLLVVAGTLYLLMGKPGDALVLLGFVLVVMGITIIQERRTERALDALRDLSSPRALVLRMGRRQRIAGTDVVRGDILLLNEGDRVPADAILRRSSSLSVDESLLTGESVPVRKVPSDSARELDSPGGDELPSIFAGTLVTSGQGIAEVVATGVRSGKLARRCKRSSRNLLLCNGRPDELYVSWRASAWRPALPLRSCMV